MLRWLQTTGGADRRQLNLAPYVLVICVMAPQRMFSRFWHVSFALALSHFGTACTGDPENSDSSGDDGGGTSGSSGGGSVNTATPEATGGFVFSCEAEANMLNPTCATGGVSGGSPTLDVTGGTGGIGEVKECPDFPDLEEFCDEYVDCSPPEAPLDDPSFRCGMDEPDYPTPRDDWVLFKYGIGCGEEFWEQVYPAEPAKSVTWNSASGQVLGAAKFDDVPIRDCFSRTMKVGHQFDCATADTFYCETEISWDGAGGSLQ